jgi:hypothetical protein
LPFVATKLTQSPWFLKTWNVSQPPSLHGNRRKKAAAATAEAAAASEEPAAVEAETS